MAQHSFDVTTGGDLQEVDNACNQARKEIAQRYDFRGSKCSIDFDRKNGALVLEADDAFRMNAVVEILKERLIKRKVPVKNLDMGEDEEAGAGRVRRRVGLVQGISKDKAREIVKVFKGEKMKKVQLAIQGEQLRATAPSIDDLQNLMSFLKSQDFGIELEFGNYR